MSLVLLAALLSLSAQSVATLPTPVPPSGPVEPPPAPRPGSLSLVVATTLVQDDPRPAPCGPRDCGDRNFRSTFSAAQTIAGAPLPEAFEARMPMHSPYNMRYRLAFIVERLDDGSLMVRRKAGFNGRNGIGCFDSFDEWPVDWTPQAPEIRWQGKSLCVFQASEIDPNAPK